LKPEKIEVVGNYALHFTWSDGHSTGIYSLITCANFIIKMKKRIAILLGVSLIPAFSWPAKPGSHSMGAIQAYNQGVQRFQCPPVRRSLGVLRQSD